MSAQAEHAPSVADSNGELVLDENVENSAYARTLAVDVVDSTGKVLAAGGTDCGDVVIAELFAAGITEVKVRSEAVAASRRAMGNVTLAREDDHDRIDRRRGLETLDGVSDDRFSIDLEELFGCFGAEARTRAGRRSAAS